MPISRNTLLTVYLLTTTSLLSVTAVFAVGSDTAQTSAQPPKAAPKAAPIAAPIVAVDTASELKNRFRIDHMVDNMTLFVERDYDSGPVIVVLPDGSKMYSDRHPKTVKWAAGITGDIIYIESPMPGPWQLIGKVVPTSTIKKVSKLEIEVQPLPQPLFQGEQIKLVAQLMGDAQRMRLPGLDYLVEWNAHFVSRHKAGDENFAAGDIIVGSYKDNGEDYDERPDDGIFTSNIDIRQPWGDYRFVVQARNNVFDRQVSSLFRLSPRPINVEVITPEDSSMAEWKVMLHVDNSALQLAETHFSFELTGPAGMQVPLIVDGLTQADSELVLPTLIEFGRYKLKGTVATTTVAGREVILDLPEQFFSLTPPPPPLPTAKELAAVAAIAAQKAADEEALAKKDAIFWIVTINVILLILGVLGLVVWRKRQSLAQALAAAELRVQQQKPVKQAPAPSLDDIDLTLPDETDNNN
ncbi:TIGR03503 family protein [Shewanella morhuae]|uniref:TIGR03503 family protein n=1 Tax=Shewanella morhuae TaxID=365591 RepID=UPI000970B97D|nr:TIGR03503 family protein [Shewanella morhuae]